MEEHPIDSPSQQRLIDNDASKKFRMSIAESFVKNKSDPNFEEVESAIAKHETTLMEEKIIIMLRNAGNAPVLQNNKIRVNSCENMTYLLRFIRSQLGSAIKPEENLFLYVNGNFAPSPHHVLGELYNTFKINNTLIVNYAKSEAWG